MTSTETHERTLVFLKPDTFEKNITGKVVSEFESRKMSIIAQKKIQLIDTEVAAFYAVHRHAPFYHNLVIYISRGPILVMALQGENIIKEVRHIIGTNDPLRADEGTIRQRYGESLDANVVHASDSPEAAEQEISFFFSELELMRVDNH